MKRRIVAIVLLVLVGTACSNEVPTIDVEFRIPVETRVVETDDVERVITATGTLRPRSLATVNNEVPGFIYISRNSEGDRLVEGESVVVGQTLAEVTGEDARLHAGIESRRVSLENVKAELDRRRNLFEQGLIAESDLRQQEVAHEQALLEYERSKLNAAKSKLTSPIAGVILKLARNDSQLPVADGQLISPGFKIAEIAPLDRLVADVDLVGPELAQIRKGMPVRVRHFAYPEPNEGFVQQISPSLNAQTHTFRVEIAVDNTNGNFRPGMFVEVRIIIASRTDVPVVPRNAVTRRNDASVAFVVNGQRVARREIRLGLSDDDKHEIVDGIQSGEVIVVRGLETLTDGTYVRIVGS